MSICSGIGNGIGGALGKWGAGLGSALGLAALVDVGTRAYTGYGLLETLSVPYIECPDGSFVSAIEWYGSGLKCSPEKEPTINSLKPSSSQKKAAQGYNELIKALGGATFTYWGAHEFGAWTGSWSTVKAEIAPEHWKPQPQQIDKYGNVLRTGLITQGRGDSQVFSSFVDGNVGVKNYGWGGWRSSSYPNGVSTDSAFSPEFADYLTDTNWQPHIGYQQIVGIRAALPAELPKGPPAANIPRRQGFRLPDRQKKENCEMSCPCVTPLDIERAVRKALGLTPFAPEKLIREMGAKMYAASGPSLIPIAPANLVEAIAAIVAANYMRAGYGRYPVVMPSSLIASDNPAGDAVPTNVIENFAEWFEWYLKQKDATDGEWPIDIAIVDGAKRQPLRFENLAEAIAELTGLVIQTATDADAAVNAACTAAVAATKATNAAIVGQKNVECLIQFFGVRTGFKAVFVQSPITPADPDDKNFNLRKFLTPSTQTLACLTDQDPFDLPAVLDRILRNTEVSRASVARNIEKDGLPGDFVRNQKKYDATASKREAEKELEDLEKSIQAKNPDFKVKIKVDTPASDDDVTGNNFVIKRSR